ncbi:MAG: ABC transporter ATP-binding protein/permease [Lachnospiraceae bacterium]|nr:ABC transporter ATP-binding protein/permease [Lachnospiraceae bacterium]
MFDKRLMAMCPESKKYIAGNIIFQWLELCMNAVMIGLIALSAEKLYRRELTLSGALPSLLLIALTILVRFFTTRYAVRMSYLASRTVKRKMRERIYRKLLRLGPSYREKVTTAELVQESVEGVDQLESYFGQYVPQFFYAFIAPVTLFALFTAAGSLRTGLVLLVCVPLIPATIVIVQKIAKRILAKYWDQYARLGSTFLENLQGMTTLKIYQADEFKNEQMNEESEHFRVVTMKVLTMQLNSIIIMDLLAYGGAAVGIILATKEFVNGSLEMAPCLFMILLSADFFLPMRRLGSYFHVAMNGMAASDRIFRFLALEEPDEGTELFPKNGGNFLLKSVSFSYDGEREVLHRINMQIPKNSFMGIVGESGSGKSTIASLLTGRLTAEQGEISISGVPIADCTQESLMRGITYIGPSSYFFKGTVRDNLLMGDPSASDERLLEVLRTCRMDTFPGEESALDLRLTENAQNLSGGQKQRLALARALLHDSPVYIFDEATSNIDVESEQIIMDRIRALAGGKTVILISHRLVNTREADRIFVMENGKLVESGNHRELMKWGGTYAVLWRMQQKLERFGRDDDSGEKWLTGEIDRMAATGELDLTAAAKASESARVGDTKRIGDPDPAAAARISDAAKMGDTKRFKDTDLIGGNTGRIGDTGRIRIRKEGDHDAH